MRSDWSFDTIRSTSAMGTLRSMARDIALPPTIRDDDEQFDGSMRSSTTALATQGSQPSAMDELAVTEEDDLSGIFILFSVGQTQFCRRSTASLHRFGQNSASCFVCREKQCERDRHDS